MTIVSLTTDFGLKDGNVGVMKGVIWSIAPEARIADLSHEMGPQNVAEAGWVLARHAPYFPPGTIHVCVIDPGVGTERRPVAARLGGQLFVGPDNGLITRWLDKVEASGEPVNFVHLDRREYWLAEISNVFQGRDIFSPVAAHLARGVALEAVGSPIDDLIRLPVSRPARRDGELLGEVAHIDHFGNVATNLRRQDVGEASRLTVEVAGREVEGPVRTFGDRSPGELVALYGSTGDLILAEVNGSAARLLGVRVGDPVRVRLM